MGVLLLFFIYWIQFWDYEYLMHTLYILSLNVTGFNSAVKRTCVLEHLHRKSISGALICNTTSSGTFLHMFWECPVVIDLWTHVNLVLSSSLQTDCFANPSLCLLNDDSGLFISLITKRRLFAGFVAAKEDNDTELVYAAQCGKTYWIHSLCRWWLVNVQQHESMGPSLSLLMLGSGFFLIF